MGWGTIRRFLGIGLILFGGAAIVAAARELDRDAVGADLVQKLFRVAKSGGIFVLVGLIFQPWR